MKLKPRIIPFPISSSSSSSSSSATPMMPPPPLFLFPLHSDDNDNKLLSLSQLTSALLSSLSLSLSLCSSSSLCCERDEFSVHFTQSVWAQPVKTLVIQVQPVTCCDLSGCLFVNLGYIPEIPPTQSLINPGVLIFNCLFLSHTQPVHHLRVSLFTQHNRSSFVLYAHRRI